MLSNQKLLVLGRGIDGECVRMSGSCLSGSPDGGRGCTEVAAPLRAREASPRDESKEMHVAAARIGSLAVLQAWPFAGSTEYCRGPGLDWGL